MIVELAKCPHCGGKFDPGADICIYCGFGLIYGDTEEIIKKNIEVPRFMIREGEVRSLAFERGYYGCPVCLKKVYNGYNLCDHGREPVVLYWRKYNIGTEVIDFVIDCTPLVKRLMIGARYRFTGTFYPNEDRFVVKEVIKELSDQHEAI